ncbi:hypothetical protein KKY_398 [Pelagibacterium halotolerans B2]|uniref:Uncharacterized protein n=1 Tax=Pelagibacterium halotolerans (strain DSM 22347 / JCM 15775 / CGMCC 1.7692 / B2) TaxID=1082931 RepID=G4R9M5_PELHB|nr:hypothetical protein KKY_398 [Pelagibacterium halotolerans B2]
MALLGQGIFANRPRKATRRLRMLVAQRRTGCKKRRRQVSFLPVGSGFEAPAPPCCSDRSAGAVRALACALRRRRFSRSFAANLWSRSGLDMDWPLADIVGVLVAVFCPCVHRWPVAVEARIRMATATGTGAAVAQW